MKTSEFDYVLPEELIAQEPVSQRDQSRLLVVNRKTGEIVHARFSEIQNYLVAGDVLALNNTKVLPARLYGKRPTGGKIEILLLKEKKAGVWETLVNPGKKVELGMEISFPDTDVKAYIQNQTEYGGRIVEFVPRTDFKNFLKTQGQVPLPPYVKKELKDYSRYQTVYADKEGAVAAPTAGLHFTDKLLASIKSKGVEVVNVTLHTGLGSFRPIKTETIEGHKIEPEYFELPPATADTISKAKKESRRIVAVGTTVVRTLESQNGQPGKGQTDLYIYPGYKFNIVDTLVTNFHLPKSTLFALVCAFAGKELIHKAYQEAIKEKYRFYSFGDSMLIL